MIIFFLCRMWSFLLLLDPWISLSLSLSMEQITMPLTYQRHPLEILQCPPEGHFQLQVSKQLCDDKEVT